MWAFLSRYPGDTLGRHGVSSLMDGETRGGSLGSLDETNSDSGFFFVLSLLSCTKNSPIFSSIPTATNMISKPHKIDRHIVIAGSTTFVFSKLITLEEFNE